MTDPNYNGVELTWPGKNHQKSCLNAALNTQHSLYLMEHNDRPADQDRDGLQKLLPLDSAEPKTRLDPGWRNKLAWGDNLPIMSCWSLEYSGLVDLVYIDPPFASGTNFSIKYKMDRDNKLHRVNFWESKNDAFGLKIAAREKAYQDKWDQGIGGYLNMMYPRLALIHKLLSSEGHLFLHCDWHINAYLRILLDEIFSPNCFKSEIIWQRSKTSGRVLEPRKFDMLSDSILFYSKTPQAKINKQKKKRFFTIEEAQQRFKFDSAKNAFYKDSPCGNYSKDSIQRLDHEGRIYWTSKGKPRVKTYLLTEMTNHGERVVEELWIGNIWTDILGMMHVGKHETTGYPTQKPVSLLERIISAGSKEGSLVADFFCGSGTTLIAAQNLKRRWLGCDSARSAIEITRDRLLRPKQKDNCDQPESVFYPFEVLDLDNQ